MIRVIYIGRDLAEQRGRAETEPQDVPKTTVAHPEIPEASPEDLERKNTRIV